MISERHAKQYCCEPLENIENYEQANADTKKWDIHHRLEVDDEGNTLYTRKELIAMNMYNHRPASELIFVTRSMHLKIHKADHVDGCKKGAKTMNLKLTHEHRVKAGKTGAKVLYEKLTPEQLTERGKRMNAKLTPEQRSANAKAGGKAMKGMLWWNDGYVSERSPECPGPNWVRGRIGCHIGKLPWWNNGTVNKRSADCPGEGWKRGHLPFKKTGGSK